MGRHENRPADCGMAPGKQLSRVTLNVCLDRIRGQYLADSRPWVLGYSGGKDSTCLLQLVWQALEGIPEERRKKQVHVITSDTYVESPAVERHLARSLALIDSAARRISLPIVAHRIGPTVDDSFWVNLIGRGYPAPYSSFRWCTDRMKIQPANDFVCKAVAEHGEVVVLLGARKAESASRAQTMGNRREVGGQLFRHSTLANAWVFTPIEDWSTQDVWTYVTSRPSLAWGADKHELVTMYRNAQAGECPLVIDKSTPSCGGGRFGCWVCTVVDRDRTMEAMIDNGEDWLQPMLDFRNWLAATRDPARKKDIREPRRRTGQIEFFGLSDNRKLRPGPFTLTFRKEILAKLLLAEKSVRHEGPDPEVRLIREEELHRIRQLWLHEEGDWEDSLPGIYESVTGERLDWLTDDWSGMGGAEKDVLESVSRECGVPSGLLMELMDTERRFHGMSRRAGIYQQLSRVLRKDWRTVEQAWADQKTDSPADESEVEEVADAH